MERREKRKGSFRDPASRDASFSTSHPRKRLSAELPFDQPVCGFPASQTSRLQISKSRGSRSCHAENIIPKRPRRVNFFLKKPRPRKISSGQMEASQTRSSTAAQTYFNELLRRSELKTRQLINFQFPSPKFFKIEGLAKTIVSSNHFFHPPRLSEPSKHENFGRQASWLWTSSVWTSRPGNPRSSPEK